MVWVVLGVFLVGAVVILLFSRVYIHFSLDYSRRKPLVSITFRLFGFRFLTKKIDLAQWETTNKWEEQFSGKHISDKIKQLEDLIKSFFDMMHDMGMAARDIAAKLSIHQLNWHSRIGTGKADTTGIAIGGIWTTKGLMLGVLDHMSNVKCKPVVSVTPEFNRKYVSSKIECMVSIRIGQAIHAFIKVMRKSSFRKREALIHEGGL